ncbi:hypothetical protein LCGC14_1886910 [marine sediment metagenome]|uniref:Uncharacterized protein n=1 Tax=marine sediment metagenome TaxID=412755 RepID=A0A0F9IYW8_9ZZZZ
MKGYTILGCDGRQDDGFKTCSGVRNIILDLEKIEASENYLELIKYLDKVPKIFDGPCFKPHIISNAICKMYEMGYISDKLHQYIAHFYGMHRLCGLILECCPKEK